jgi:hypothetical protein
MSERQPLSEAEHRAMDKFGEALSHVVDSGQPATILIQGGKDVLTAFGEDWSDDE